METKVTFLVDTCILIDYLRGIDGIYTLFEKDENTTLLMSTVTMMELMTGAHNKLEIQRIKKAFKHIHVVHIDDTISRTAQDLVEQYTKSHNMQIQDALIAATAIALKVMLITYNVSDFRYIPHLSLF